MTALIGALNKHGAAIAADSAATIGNGHYDKVYNTANKIFTLSKIHPVGIMVCGNAEFKGFPWDIIIKSYRKNLGSKSFDYIKDYVEDFINYLRSSEIPFSNFKIPQKIINQFINDATNLLVNKIIPRPKGNTITIPPILELCNKIRKEIETIEFPNECMNMFDNIRKLLSPHSSLLASRLYPNVTDSANLAILQLLIDQFIFALFLINNKSQLVFVGYGEKEFFPSISASWIYSSLDSDWQNGIPETQNITHQLNAIICPFAQRDDMTTLIEGIHPDLEKAISNVVGNTLFQYRQDILSNIQEPKLKSVIQNIDLGKYVNFFRQSVLIQKGQAYTRPLVSHIGMLEKEDLALLAENLIAITSLRKKVTMAPESVGGPIDVAVISKHDGFIWLKRKLYFDKEINPQYRENYYRDCISDNINDPTVTE